jgi:transcriptional pleiotropic regulator of transition state genes
MKATGIVRKVDNLGRIVLPMELRRTMKIAEKDPLEIYINGTDIALRKYNPGCAFCGNTENLITRGEHTLCSKPPINVKGYVNKILCPVSGHSKASCHQ